MNGCAGYKGCPKPDIINGRKIIGINIPDTEPAWHSRYSVTVANHPFDEVCHRIYAKIPKELFPLPLVSINISNQDSNKDETVQL